MRFSFTRTRDGLLAFLLGVALSGCGTPGPQILPAGAPTPAPGTRTHIVQKGETAWRISQRYGSSVDAIRRANGLRDVTQLRVGQHLVVPLHARRVASKSARAWTRSDERGTRGVNHAFSWPVRGTLTSRYGVRRGAHHDGLDISAGRGTQIRAAEAGRVIHSGNGFAGYGNLIILKHTGAYSTVYAHNRKNHVRVGEFVERGQVIGEVGATGRATAPHLHFEVRRDGQARDPLHYLP